MERDVEIILKAIIQSLANQEGGRQFANDLTRSLFDYIEESALAGDPVTSQAVGRFAQFAREARDRISG